MEIGYYLETIFNTNGAGLLNVAGGRGELIHPALEKSHKSAKISTFSPNLQAISQICTFFCQICTFFFLPKSCQFCTFFCQICTFFLFNVKRIFCCKICLYWVRLGLGSPQGLEKPPARARKAPCKGQDSNLSYFMVKKGADLTTFGWRKRCRFDKKRCRFDNFLSDTKKVQI